MLHQCLFKNMYIAKIICRFTCWLVTGLIYQQPNSPDTLHTYSVPSKIIYTDFCFAGNINIDILIQREGKRSKLTIEILFSCISFGCCFYCANVPFNAYLLFINGLNDWLNIATSAKKKMIGPIRNHPMAGSCRIRPKETRPRTPATKPKASNHSSILSVMISTP